MKRITFEIPDDTVAMMTTVLCGPHPCDLQMISHGVTTKEINQGEPIKIERAERRYE